MHNLILHCKETIQHKLLVAYYLSKIVVHLCHRLLTHDFSKLMPTEAKEFSRISHILRCTKFGTPEYKKVIESLDMSIIQHHYSVNRHHPEHFKNGISDMNIVDLIEAFCDWQAASHRNKNGNKIKSLNICKDRFELSEDLYNILKNSL